MTIDNYLEALLPLEKNKGRKMRNRTKNIVVDYQTNKEENIDWEIHCPLSFDNCQLTKVPAGPNDFINFMDFINFQLI